MVKLKNDEDIDGGIEWINGKQESFGKEYYIECDNLKKGKYYAFIEYDWEDNILQDKRIFNLCCYGASDIRYKDESHIQTNTKEKFLKKAFLAKLEKTPEGLELQTMADKGAPNIHRYMNFT